MDRFKGCHLFLEKCFTLIMFCTELRHLLDGVISVGSKKYLFQFFMVETKINNLFTKRTSVLKK